MPDIDRDKLFRAMQYDPMKHQLAYHAARDNKRFRTVCAGRRTGKSVMGGNDRCIDLMTPRDSGAPSLGWIVGPTYDLGAKEFRAIWQSLMVNMKLIHDKRIKKAFNIKTGDMYIEFPWNTRVEVRSATVQDSLVGEGLNWVIMSEAAKHKKETWERYVRAALSDKRGSADFLSTPEGKNWFYETWKLGQTEESYMSWRMPSWVNTKVFPGGAEDEEIQLVKRTTVEEWFLQEYAAEFTAVVGRIFGEFDEELHVIDYKFNPEWPNYMCFDWGFTNPLACIEFQVSPMGKVYVWREHQDVRRTLEWHLDAIKSREQPEGYRLDGIYGDAADPDAVQYVSDNLGFCEADSESKIWAVGIRLMKSFLKLDQVGFDEYEMPIMEPSYFVDRSCTFHIHELLGYRGKVDGTGNEFTGASVIPKGVSDHSIDAVRYGMMHVFELQIHHHLDELSDINNPVGQVRDDTVKNVDPQVNEILQGVDTFFPMMISHRTRF